MSAIVVWLDHQEATVFALEEKGPHRRHLKFHGPKHSNRQMGRRDGGAHPDAEKWYGQLAEELKDASELLVMGPGQAKIEFKTHLERKFPTGLAKKIVGVETVDHPTDNQILEKARKFFKNYDLFH